MKLQFVFLLCFVLFPAFIVAAQETSGSFKGGSLAIGYDNRACNASLAGNIRYNSGAPAMEYCDGINWNTW
ncbi:MAG: hypothetical protein V7731_01200 [Amphritea sp.]